MVQVSPYSETPVSLQWDTRLIAVRRPLLLLLGEAFFIFLHTGSSVFIRFPFSLFLLSFCECIPGAFLCLFLF